MSEATQKEDMDIYEYCAEMMMATELAKWSHWKYDEILARFRGMYPDEKDFRKEMRGLEKSVQEATGTSYSWIDDFDGIKHAKCPEHLRDVGEVLRRGKNC